jgi:hypothetical protein
VTEWQAEGQWVRVIPLTAEEKASITQACEHLLQDILKPRFLPAIRPTAFNYPIALHGRWRGAKYTFYTRYRSGFPENAGEEFDAPFARLDLDETCQPRRFDVMWYRHTGRWWPLHTEVPLARALHLIATDQLLSPV